MATGRRAADAGKSVAAASGDAPADESLVRLHQELLSLFGHLNRLRDELSAIKFPVTEDLHFSRTGSQLQAIVVATEQATNTIMEAVERNEELIAKVRKEKDVEARSKLLDTVSENNFSIVEACSFQDLTGQRVNKVIKFVAHIESRIEALCEIWGRDGIGDKTAPTNEGLTDDEKLLRGPSLKGEGISQKDIDALFD